MAELASVEFRIGRVIGHSFGVFRRNFVGFSILALLISLLQELFFLFYPNSAALKAPEVGFGTVAVAYLVWVSIWLLIESLTTAAVVFGTFQDLRGSKVRIVKCITHGVATMLPHIAASLLYTIVLWIALALFIVPGFFLADWLATMLPHIEAIVFLIVLALSIVPGFFLYVMLRAYVPTRVVEDRRILGSFGRSAELTKGRRWRIFGLTLVVLAVIIPVAQLLPWAVFAALGFHGVASIVAYVMQALVAAFSAVVGAVTYYYLRAEKEGINAAKMAASATRIALSI